MRKMKDSGIEWIGEIPDDWNMKRLRFLCSIETGNMDTQDNNPEGKYPFYVRSPIVEHSDNYTFDNEAVLMAGDGVGAGKVFHYVKGKYGCHQRVYSMSDLQINGKYLYYFLSEIFYKKIEESNAKSTVDSVRLPMLKNFIVVFPKENVQELIVNYLDTQCAHIDSVIEKTKQSIEEYKKLKQAVITQAVTKGVRGEREMKDSGIEWIGQIPSDWKTSRVGLHFDIILGKMLCPNQISDDYTLESYFCAANVHFDGISQDNIKQMWFSSDEKKQYKVNKGDLLVVEGGAGAGGSAIVKEINGDFYIQNSIMIVRSKGKYLNQYLRYLIEYLVKSGYVDLVCNKATIPHFTKDKLANVPFILNEEQQEIAAYLDQKCAEIDTLITKKEQFLTELESYKKSMIYEYVTGKKEVEP